MDPTLVSGTRFESQFQICVYEHAILRIYISFFSNIYNLKRLLRANLSQNPSIQEQVWFEGQV